MRPAATAHPAVSIVVPCYGHQGDSLERLLRSLGRQDYPGRREIILVDNHPEPSITIRQPPEGTRLLHEPRPGSYAARNAALRVASGDIIAFTDADCECAGDWLSRGVEALLQAPQPGIVAGLVTPRPAAGGGHAFAARYDSFFHMRQHHYVMAMRFAATANAFVRRELFGTVGLFDERLRSGGDREWCARAVAAGHRLGWQPAAVVLHETRNVAGLVTKARRLAGQQWSHARIAGAGISSAAGQELAFYRGRLQRLLDRSEELSLPDRLGFFGLASLLQAVRFAELLRLSLTRAEPERR